MRAYLTERDCLNHHTKKIPCRFRNVEYQIHGSTRENERTNPTVTELLQLLLLLLLLLITPPPLLLLTLLQLLLLIPPPPPPLLALLLLLTLLQLLLLIPPPPPPPLLALLLLLTLLRQLFSDCVQTWRTLECGDRSLSKYNLLTC